jgi:hypothetical protein
MAAQRFLNKYDLPQSYTEQVVEFIQKNTGGVQLGQGEQNTTGGGVPTSSGAGGSDPFTGTYGHGVTQTGFARCRRADQRRRVGLLVQPYPDRVQAGRFACQDVPQLHARQRRCGESKDHPAKRGAQVELGEGSPGAG